MTTFVHMTQLAARFTAAQRTRQSLERHQRRMQRQAALYGSPIPAEVDQLLRQRHAQADRACQTAHRLLREALWERIEAARPLNASLNAGLSALDRDSRWVQWTNGFDAPATVRQDGYSPEQAQAVCDFQRRAETDPACDYEALAFTLRVVRSAPFFCPHWVLEAFYQAARPLPDAAAGTEPLADAA